jgi:hypothetical protein
MGEMNSEDSKRFAIERLAWESVPADSVSACGCMGPQYGQPLCPCRMRGVIERDGRYYLPEQDLGPVPEILIHG